MDKDRKTELMAHAKINLSLDIVGEREDGYHLLRMVMQTLKLADKIEVSVNESGHITTFTDSGAVSDDKSNLGYRAAELLLKEFGIGDGVDIRIQKNIPVAAGLAGGSADAAAVLKAVNELFELALTDEELAERGVRLGADIPYCIYGGTMLSEGIGEKLTRLRDLEVLPVILVKPPKSVSTVEVYKSYRDERVSLHPQTDELVKEINSSGSFDERKLANVLESVTLPMVPEIDEIKRSLIEHGAYFSMMSGSGPTVFGLFKQQDTADRAFSALKAQYKEMTVISTCTCNVTV